MIIRKLLLLLSLFLPIAASAGEIFSDSQVVYTAPGIDNGEILIDFSNDETPQEISQLLSDIGLRTNDYSWLSREEKWLSVRKFVSQLSNLKHRSDVEAIEPNYYATAMYAPNDPYYKYQWHLDLIGMQKGWDFPRGKEIIVAVIDTGVAFEKHGSGFPVEDLGESQFVKPFNFVAGNEHANDDHGHGTHVAGTIAQLTNNGIGVAGVAPYVKIMPLKVLNSRGFGTYGAIASAIRYAADNGAGVINMSLGGPFPSFVLHKAIKYAKDKGVVVVCAAGNSGRSGLSYPAAYKECISVSAVRYDKTLSWYSSYGKGLTIAAPGGDMNVDQNGDGLMDGVLQNTLNPQDPTKQGYFLFQGTSMATPHVAAAAALLKAQGIEDPDKVREYLQSSAIDVEGGSPEKYGAGVLNVPGALSSAFTTRKFTTFTVALMVFLLLITLINRSRKSMDKVPFRFTSLLGLLLGSTGLFFLARWIPHFGSFYVTHSVFEWTRSNLVLWSVLPTFLVVLLAYPWKKAIPAAIGFACGAAAFLIVQSFSPVANLQWIPGTILDSAWLLIHGLLSIGMALIASFRLR